MILRATSHRAIQRIKAVFPDASVYYCPAKIFHHETAKGYYLVPDEKPDLVADLLKLGGISKPKDQDIKHYYACWMV